MAMEHAKSFVGNLFEDDEFLKLVIEKRGFERTENPSEEAENRRMVEIANQMGFKFDLDEYIEANKTYMNDLGGWEASRRIFHMIKIAANMARENKE